MVYKRYANPLSLLSTFSLATATDFIVYLQSEELEERIWQQYLHTSMEMSFIDFKKRAGYTSMRKSKAAKSEEITDDEIVKRLNSFNGHIKLNFERKEE